jgi:type II secretory pathway pseudopilin PulG
MNRSLRKKANRGFALIASLLLMILLVVVAVGLLSLSSISLRSTSSSQARQMAEGNARLAMMLALGRLQETLGDDRRVTANASILEKSDSAVPRPQMVGVWESATSTLRNSPTGSGSIPYADWKSSKFKSWLVSSADPDATQTLDFGKAAVPEDNVGLFKTESDGFDLQVEKINVAKLSNKNVSSMAYAVVQEADKAHISLPGDIYQNKTDVVRNRHPAGRRLERPGVAFDFTESGFPGCWLCHCEGIRAEAGR